MAKVGLVTVLYNSNDVLEGFLDSLSSQSFSDYHLYIIDNTPSSTTDGVLYNLLKKFPVTSFSHLKSIENIGIAKGNNLGIKAALSDRCRYVLLLNNDIEFHQTHLLKSLVEKADSSNESLLITKIYYYESKKIWMAGGHFEWPKAMAFHVGQDKEDSSKYDQDGYFDYAPTCFMLIRSNVFDKIGFMDEKYFVYFDDTDFVYRATEIGYKLYYCAQLKILHKVGSSTGGEESLFSIYYGNRNRIYFIRKHFKSIKKAIAFSFVLSTRIIKYINYNKPQRMQLVKSIRDGFAMKMNDL